MGNFRPSNLFRIAINDVLKKQGRGAQSILADRTKTPRSALNDLLKGRRNGTEELREKLAADLGYTYEEMIALGRRLADPAQADGVAPHKPAPPAPPPMPYDNITFDESVKLLKTIYNSGEDVLVRAIAANLHAFAETVETKSKASTMERGIEAMAERVGKLEKIVERMERENQAL